MEELERLAGAGSAAAFDPKEHARLYKAQPKERRRVVNVLYRAGGEMEYARLLSETSSVPETLRALYALGLVTPLPSAEAPDRVVLPLERLFATPLIENEPDKLVEALKVYPREVLWAIAMARGVPVNGTDEITLRARLYRHALGGGRFEELPSSSLAPLILLRGEDWVMESDRLFSRLRLTPPSGGRSAETLFASLRSWGGALLDLLLRMLVVPVRVSPGSSFYRDFAVPRELRTAVLKLASPPPPSAAPRKPAKPPAAPAGPHPDCVLDRPLEWDSREGRFPGDLARFVLLFDQDPPSLTQKGDLNRRDLLRLRKASDMEEETFESLSILARSLPLIETRGDGTRISPKAGELVSLGAPALVRRLLAGFPVVRINAPRTWFSDSQCLSMRDMVLSELSARARGPAEPLCLHCLARRISESKEFGKLLVYTGVEPYGLARTLWESFARMFHVAGIAAVAVKGGRIAALKVTEVGRRGFDRTPIAAAADVAGDAQVIVQPTGEIIVPRGVPFEELRRVSRACDVKGVDAVAILALTRESLLRAAQRGEDPAGIRAVLESRSKAPLPRTVTLLFEEIGARMGEVEILPCAAVLRVRDAALLKDLDGVTALGDGLAMLRPGADPEELHALLRKRGHLPRMARREGAPEGEGSGRDEMAILDVLDDAADSGEPVELRFRGGGADTVEIEEFDGDTVWGDSLVSGKQVRYAFGSIIGAQLASER